MNFKNLSGLAVAAVVLPLFANGCSAAESALGAQDALCCAEFVPGTDMSAAEFGIKDVKVRGQFRATAQGAGDLVSLADTLLGDVTNACRNIAIDLGATATEIEANDKLAANAKVTAWCGAASAAVSSAFSMFQLKAEIDAEIKCEASVQANVDCKARCDVDAKCDVKVNPPVCKGGELTVDCKGSCDVTAELPKIECEGSCAATCEGSCSATVEAPSVQCNGTCNGTCEAGGSGGGSGIQADGSCNGTCKGTCTAKPGSAAVQCGGVCKGKCTGSCTTTPGSASVKCSGKCNADFTPVECKGGTLEGGCTVDAKCEGSCNASAQAKASCTPPRVNITGSVDPKAQAAIDTLQKNLPELLIAVKARGQAFANLVQNFDLNVSGEIGVSGAACVTRMAASMLKAVDTSKVSLEGAVKVTGSAKIN